MRIIEKFKAWRRGERMIPGASRGRCFEKRDGSDNSLTGPIKVNATPKLELVGIRVIRKDGSVEEIKNG